MRSIALCFTATLVLAACGPEPTKEIKKTETAALTAPAPTTPQPAPAAEPPPAEKPASPDEAAQMANILLGKSKPAQETRVQVARRPQQPKRRVEQASHAAEAAEAVEEDPTELSDERFYNVVGSWAGVKRCLATTALGADEPVTGAITVSLTIATDGSVLESKVNDTAGAAAKALTPCVERQAKMIRFPAFAGASEPVTKEAKFVF